MFKGKFIGEARDMKRHFYLRTRIKHEQVMETGDPNKKSGGYPVFKELI